ncbi:MAG: hypothetical protein WCD07_00570 [Burkholderiales bacterium]
MSNNKKFWQNVAVYIGCLVGLVGASTASAGESGPPGTYTDVSLFAAGDLCSFPLKFTGDGKLKIIFLKGGQRIIGMAPGVVNTITNLDQPDKVFTRKVGGSTHVTNAVDGSALIELRGQLYYFGGPTDSPSGLWLLIGNYSLAFDATGNLTQPLAGQGRMIDICGLLE